MDECCFDDCVKQFYKTSFNFADRLFLKSDPVGAVGLGMLIVVGV